MGLGESVDRRKRVYCETCAWAFLGKGGGGGGGGGRGGGPRGTGGRFYGVGVT